MTYWYTPSMGIHGALDSLNTSALEKITKTYVIFHVAVLLACMITLLAICNNKIGLGLHTEYVWTEVVNNSGWTPNGWSWMFGFLAASWTMTDYEPQPYTLVSPALVIK